MVTLHITQSLHSTVWILIPWHFVFVKWVEIARKGCKCLEMAGYGWKLMEWMEMTGITGNEWTLLEMDGHCLKWMVMAGNGWTWVELLDMDVWLEMAGNG